LFTAETTGNKRPASNVDVRYDVSWTASMPTVGGMNLEQNLRLDDGWH